MGAQVSLKALAAGAAAVAAAAQVAGAGTWVGSAVDSFLHDPNSGPAWATGATSSTATPKHREPQTAAMLAAAKQQAQVQALWQNSGVVPKTTAIDFTKP
jgi:hypothetical protein